MTARGVVLEAHALIVRDGRIVDLLPAAAAGRYEPAATVDRPSHLLMPGLVDAHANAAMSLFSDAAACRPTLNHTVGRELVRDAVLLSIARMLVNGVTCFGGTDLFPDEIARTAVLQGMRAAIGMPVSELPDPWAADADDHVSKALAVRDEYRDHPLVLTAFAPQTPVSLSDATLARVATLAAELDAGIFARLHESAVEVGESVQRHGRRPLERLEELGILTPALNAIQMVELNQDDIDRASRTGIAVSLSLGANLMLGNAAPPIAALAAAGVRLAAASGGPASNGGHDLWGEMRLLAALSGSRGAGAPALSAWDALAAATRGGASALGLEPQTGSLEAGKWADLCCVDLSLPATQPPYDPLYRLVFSGGREMVSDVWVGGRQLLAGSEFTRLDWPAVAARANVWAGRLETGGQ